MSLEKILYSVFPQNLKKEAFDDDIKSKSAILLS